MRPLTAHIGISQPGTEGRLTSLPERPSFQNWIDRDVSPGIDFESDRLSTAEAVAALAVLGLEADGGLGPPLISRRCALPEENRQFGEPMWAEGMPSSTRTQRLVLAAGIFQIHDFWDASHEAAQEAGDLGERPYSACWHAICHRREPDAGNAGYWLAKARTNPVGSRLVELIEEDADRIEVALRPLAARLIRGGTFQDRVMVELCCRARPPDDEARYLRRIQKLEMALLIGSLLESMG